MSLETWKKEFYPTKPTKRLGAIGSVKHSLRKWKGFLPASLKNHKVGRFGVWTIFDDKKEISTQCSLCVKFRLDNSDCTICPLKRFLGKECYTGVDSPWSQWVGENSNPLPMIEALEGTLKMLEREELEK